MEQQVGAVAVQQLQGGMDRVILNSSSSKCQSGNNRRGVAVHGVVVVAAVAVATGIQCKAVAVVMWIRTMPRWVCQTLGQMMSLGWEVEGWQLGRWWWQRIGRRIWQGDLSFLHGQHCS